MRKTKERRAKREKRETAEVLLDADGHNTLT